MCKKGPPKGRERRTGRRVADTPPCHRCREEATPHCHWGVVNKATKLHAVPGAPKGRENI